MKNVLGRYRSESCHWVGDGFPVRSLFSYERIGARISPFLLLDYAGPHTFARRSGGVVSVSTHTVGLRR
jgi:hypothetical protein